MRDQETRGKNMDTLCSGKAGHKDICILSFLKATVPKYDS